MREGGRDLTGHDLRDLARLEIRNFDLPPAHVDAGTGSLDGYAELRALDDGGKIRRLDFEMLDVALLDLKKDRAGLLNDRRRQPFFLFRRQTDH